MREKFTSSALRKGEVHIWSRTITFTPSEYESAFALLNSDEISRAQKYVFEKDRHEFVFSRSSLKQILASYLSVSPKEVQLTQGSFGKPMLSPNQNVFFNVSHSHGRLLIAVANHPGVGIDVERISSENVDQLAPSVLSHEELIQLRSIGSENKVRGFFKAWTQKEAFIKAIGLGLQFPVQELSVDLNPEVEAKILKTRRAQERETFSIRQLNWFQDHAASLVAAFPVSRILRYEF
jgi:4'-phosphopantetheinyl transferase